MQLHASVLREDTLLHNALRRACPRSFTSLAEPQRYASLLLRSIALLALLSRCSATRARLRCFAASAGYPPASHTLTGSRTRLRRVGSACQPQCAAGSVLHTAATDAAALLARSPLGTLHVARPAARPDFVRGALRALSVRLF